MEDKREDNQNCSVLCCVRQLCTMIRTHVSSSYIFGMLVRFRFFCIYLGFVACVSFHVSLDHFVLVLLAFVVLGLVSSVVSQAIGREECLRNNLFCVEWDVKPLLSQSVDTTRNAVAATAVLQTALQGQIDQSTWCVCVWLTYSAASEQFIHCQRRQCVRWDECQPCRVARSNSFVDVICHVILLPRHTAITAYRPGIKSRSPLCDYNMISQRESSRTTVTVTASCMPKHYHLFSVHDFLWSWTVLLLEAWTNST